MTAWRCGNPGCGSRSKSHKPAVLMLGELGAGSSIECSPCSCGWTSRFSVGLDGSITTKAWPASRRAVVALVAAAVRGNHHAESVPAATIART